MSKYRLNKKILCEMKIQGVKLMDNGEINAVHDDDIVLFLQSIEEYDKVIKGQILCVFCERVITLKNIQSIFPLDGEVKYCCNDENCYHLLNEGGNSY